MSDENFRYAVASILVVGAFTFGMMAGYQKGQAQCYEKILVQMQDATVIK